MNDIRAGKRSLRRAVKITLLALDPLVRERQSSRILSIAASVPEFAQAKAVLLYVSAFPEEVPTRGLCKLCLARGQKLVLPRVDRERGRLRLHHVVDLDRQLREGCMNIPEPASETPEASPRDVEWAWIPGIAFDTRGFRLGRGGGFYDRLIPELRPQVSRWALAYREQLVERLPVEAHDQKIDAVVTPRGVQHVSLAARPFS
jgi:5-formyltetrahydrofolate cyclo-ligase